MIIEIRDASLVERLQRLLPRPDAPYDDVIRKLLERNGCMNAALDKLAYLAGQLERQAEALRSAGVGSQVLESLNNNLEKIFARLEDLNNHGNLDVVERLGNIASRLEDLTRNIEEVLSKIAMMTSTRPIRVVLEDDLGRQVEIVINPATPGQDTNSIAQIRGSNGSNNSNLANDMFKLTNDKTQDEEVYESQAKPVTAITATSSHIENEEVIVDSSGAVLIGGNDARNNSKSKIKMAVEKLKLAGKKCFTYREIVKVVGYNPSQRLLKYYFVKTGPNNYCLKT